MFLYLLLLLYQAAQLAHILNGWPKELVEDVDWEKAFKDVAEVTAKEKSKVVATMEKKAAMFEKARVVTKKRSLKLEVRLGETGERVRKKTKRDHQNFFLVYIH